MSYSSADSLLVSRAESLRTSCSTCYDLIVVPQCQQWKDGTVATTARRKAATIRPAIAVTLFLDFLGTTGKLSVVLVGSSVAPLRKLCIGHFTYKCRAGAHEYLRNMSTYSLDILCFRRAAWIAYAGHPEFADLPLNQLKNRKLCGAHFAQDAFANKQKTCLKKSAIPTLPLGPAPCPTAIIVPSTSRGHEEVIGKLTCLPTYSAYTHCAVFNADPVTTTGREDMDSDAVPSTSRGHDEVSGKGTVILFYSRFTFSCFGVFCF